MIRRWSTAWTGENACLVLHRLATKLAAVHRCGLAIGDFSDGNNVLLVGREPVFCDLDVGAPGYPNRDYGFDLELLAEIAAGLATVRPPYPALQHAAWLAATALRYRPTRNRMSKLAAAIGRLPL